MTIECKICHAIMAKQITNTHLKSHGISTTEYKAKFGEDSLTSSDYRLKLSQSRSGENNSNFGKKWTDSQKEAMSLKKTGNTPWNKGKKTGSTENHKLGITKREEKYANGEMERFTRLMTDDMKRILSEKQTQYLLDHPDESKLRAAKAVETKIQHEYDFGKPMRGKKHSEETKIKISIKSKETNTERKKVASAKRLEKIKEANLSLVTENNKVLELVCRRCNNVFSLTTQCFTDSKFKLEWCQLCFPKNNSYRSNAEIELFDFVQSLCPDAIHSNRQIVSKKELDIYIPSKKIAIEYNGLYWHSESVLIQNGNSFLKDYEKMKEVTSMGIRYIGIFEDEWEFNKDIVKSRLKNILNHTPNTIYARKCVVKHIPSTLASAFCKKNHIQGSGRSNIRLGLFYNETLISVMTFSKSNISRKIETWEINRFCTILDTNVIGGASKLFKSFLKEVNPSEVISYADLRWSNGDLYTKLDFEFVKDTSPNYWYFLPNDLTRIHRYSLRKSINDPKDISEKDLRTIQGYYRIWDCGNKKYIWKKGP